MHKPAFRPPQCQQCSSQTPLGRRLQETGLCWKQWEDMFSHKLHRRRSPASSEWLPCLWGDRGSSFTTVCHTDFHKYFFFKKRDRESELPAQKVVFFWHSGRFHLSYSRNEPKNTDTLLSSVCVFLRTTDIWIICGDHKEGITQECNAAHKPPLFNVVRLQINHLGIACWQHCIALHLRDLSLLCTLWQTLNPQCQILTAKKKSKTAEWREREGGLWDKLGHEAMCYRAAAPPCWFSSAV